jgi:DNA-binding response OmpR family regulator
LPGRVNGFIGSVFVVEDEPLILLELQQMLSDLGWKVAHFASDIGRAIEIARSAEFDLGILDVNVQGHASGSVAEILRSKQVPVIVATGYNAENIIEDYPGVIFYRNPI